MITNAQVKKSIKFLVGGGYETMEVGIQLDFEVDNEDMTNGVSAQIAEHTKMVDVYCKEERDKHQKIISTQSAFKKTEVKK